MELDFQKLVHFNLVYSILLILSILLLWHILKISLHLLIEGVEEKWAILEARWEEEEPVEDWKLWHVKRRSKGRLIAWLIKEDQFMVVAERGSLLSEFIHGGLKSQQEVKARAKQSDSYHDHSYIIQPWRLHSFSLIQSFIPSGFLC